MWCFFRKGNSAQQRFVRIEANLAYMACASNDVSQSTTSRFRAMYGRCTCFCLIKDGLVTITAVVHVYDIYPVGQKEMCYRLCVDLNRMIPAKNLGECKYYGDAATREIAKEVP